MLSDDGGRNWVARSIINFVRYYLDSISSAEAMHAAKEAAKKNPCPETLYELVDVFIDTREAQVANDALDQLKKDGAHVIEHYHYWYSQGVSCLSVEKLQDSSAAFVKMKKLIDRIYSENKKDPYYKKLQMRFHREFSLLHLFGRNYDIFSNHVNQALSLEENDFLMRYLQAVLKLHNRDFVHAEALLYRLLKEVENGVCGINAELYRLLGFVYLYQKSDLKAIESFNKCLTLYKGAYRDPHLIMGLFDAYINAQLFDKADQFIRLVSEGSRRYLVSSRLFEASKKSGSYAIVYIWNITKRDDFGHSAMKIGHNGQEFYFSWFPPKENSPLPRNTPPTYGRRHAVFDDAAAELQIANLFGNCPENHDVIKDGLLARSCDKTEYRKSATFKILFRDGLDFDKLIQFWQRLLKSDRKYHPRMLNCSDVILYALQDALRPTGNAQLETIKTSNMRKKLWQPNEVDPVLGSYQYRTARKVETKSTTVYQYCYRLGIAINQHYPKKNGPVVIIRYNRWNKKQKALTKFDFNPEQFNPNWLTRTQKIDKEDLYTKSISKQYSAYIFEPYDADMMLDI